MLELPRCAIIDFKDSYTRNILGLFHELASSSTPSNNKAEALRLVSERVVVIPSDALNWDQAVEQLLPHIECLILGPGPGQPDESHWTMRLLREGGRVPGSNGVSRVIPIFGLCLGCQALAVAFGGKLKKAREPRHGQPVLIQPTPGASLFTGIKEGFKAIAYHSLVVDLTTLGVGHEVEVIGATTFHAEEEIMAVQHRSLPFYGVQFHPESIASTNGVQLLRNFLDLARPHFAASSLATSSSGKLPSHVLARSTCRSTIPSPVQIPEQQTASPCAVRRSELNVADGWTTQRVFATVTELSKKGKAKSFGEIFLDSARPSGEKQRSRIALGKSALTHSHARGSRHRTSAGESALVLQTGQTFLGYMGDLQQSIARGLDNSRGKSVGFYGWISYEMGYPGQSVKDNATEDEDAVFLCADRVLEYDHEHATWTAVGLIRLDHTTVAPRVDLGLNEGEWQGWLDAVQDLLAASPELPARIRDDRGWTPGALKPDLGEAEYIAAIERAQELISEGESYELCMTTQFRATLPLFDREDHFAFYQRLRKANPAPYGAYLRFPHLGNGIEILSSSPERFMQVDGATRRVSMKPIKGTVSRSLDATQDEQLRVALEANEKERAENLMICDLSRHDLAGVCKAGSVEVTKLMKVETYHTVHQLVSEIVGTLEDGVATFEALETTFPPGSMTGAPKIASVDILHKLEKGVKRGIYSGVIGYIDLDGNADFSVVIRTIVIKGQDLTIGGGGAVTILSDPQEEWKEVLVKVNAVASKLAGNSGTSTPLG